MFNRVPNTSLKYFSKIWIYSSNHLSKFTTIINRFLSNVPFWSPWKHQKTKGFLMFSGGSKGNIGKKMANFFRSPFSTITPFKGSCSTHIETNQWICFPSQLTGFCTTGRLVFNRQNQSLANVLQNRCS